MEASEARRMSVEVTQRAPTPLEAQWIKWSLQAVADGASHGHQEAVVRWLRPPELDGEQCLAAAMFVVRQLEAQGFSARMRIRDDFMDEGPCMISDTVSYPRGTTLWWVLMTVGWER